MGERERKKEWGREIVLCERENESDSLKEGNSKKIEMAIEPYVIWNDEIWNDEIWNDEIWNDEIWNDEIWNDEIWNYEIWNYEMYVHRRNMYREESESSAVD